MVSREAGHRVAKQFTTSIHAALIFTVYKSTTLLQDDKKLNN